LVPFCAAGYVTFLSSSSQLTSRLVNPPPGDLPLANSIYVPFRDPSHFHVPLNSRPSFWGCWTSFPETTPRFPVLETKLSAAADFRRLSLFYVSPVRYIHLRCLGRSFVRLFFPPPRFFKSCSPCPTLGQLPQFFFQN